MKKFLLSLALIAAMLSTGFAGYVAGRVLNEPAPKPAPKILGIYMPGEEPPVPLRLPTGTMLVLPDGKRYKLGDTAYILDENHTTYIQQMLRAMLMRIQELEVQLRSSRVRDPAEFQKLEETSTEY
jgi:hypothetical protein